MRGLRRQPGDEVSGLCFSTLTRPVSSCSESTWLALQQGEQWLRLRAGKLLHVQGHSSACRASHPPLDRLRHQNRHQTARERSSRRETSGSIVRTRSCRKSRLPDQLRGGVAELIHPVLDRQPAIRPPSSIPSSPTSIRISPSCPSLPPRESSILPRSIRADSGEIDRSRKKAGCDQERASAGRWMPSYG